MKTTQCQQKELGALEAVENKNVLIKTACEVVKFDEESFGEWLDHIYIDGEYVGRVLNDDYYGLLVTVLDHLGYTLTIE